MAANGYVADSIDTPGGDTETGEIGPTYTNTMGDDDPALELFENLHSLGPLLRELDERERTIIEMRFGQELTQAQIGSELNVSQMQISRLLSHILAKLRTGLLDA